MLVIEWKRPVLERMLSRTKHFRQRHNAGFALGEVLVAFAVLMIVFSGLIYGYVQANRMAEWTSMSYAAQSYASEGVELARSAQWEPRSSPVKDLLPASPVTNYTMPPDIMDIPIQGSPTDTNFPFWVTNYVSISNVSSNPSVYIRQIRCDCKWTFPFTGQVQSNTVILVRTMDQ